MIVDAHLHLQDPRLDAVRSALGAVLETENIAGLVVNGTHPADWQAVVECRKAFPQVIPSFGLHPWWVSDRAPDWLEQLSHFLESEQGAVGEIGLDRWLRRDNMPEQEAVFLSQWHAANERRLPVTVHCLKAWGRLLELIQAHPHQGPGFLLHSFSGPVEMIDTWVKLGARFSVSGYFAHARKRDRLEAFRRIPLDRLLIETDAPDMAPPESLWRYPLDRDKEGKSINHPGNLRSVYECTARCLDISIETLTSQVLSNFHSLWGKLADK